jgi:hypothetical protein
LNANEFTFEDAVHVIHGESAACSLKILGCREIIILNDPMFPGPCDIDPVRHIQKRKANLLSYGELFHGPHAEGRQEIWSQIAQDLPDASDLVRRLMAFHNKPIVLWASENFSDRLNLWWILETLCKGEVDLDDYWVAEARWPHTESPYYPRSSLGGFTPAELAQAFADRSKLNRRIGHVGATLWKKFASSCPREFNKACLKNSASFPNLKNETRIYLSFFPQIGKPPESDLRLSEFDQTLLGTLHPGHWVRPIDMLRANIQLCHFMVFGDLLLIKRLGEWAGHSPAYPAILSRQEPQGDNDYTAFSYQLTWHGKRLRDYGLETPMEAPLMHLGGCSVYTQDPTWVRRWRGQRSSIESLR